MFPLQSEAKWSWQRLAHINISSILLSSFYAGRGTRLTEQRPVMKETINLHNCTD